MRLKNLLFLAFICTVNSFAQNYKILESTNDHVKIEFDFYNGYKLTDTLIDGKTFQLIRGKSLPLRKPGEPWLPAFYVNVGAPPDAKVNLNILRVDKFEYQNKFILPLPAEDPKTTPININEFDKNIYSTNQLFPAQPAEIVDDYTYRFSRIITVNASPFQFNPVSRQLIFNRKIIVQINFSALPSGLAGQTVNDKKTDEYLKNFVVNPKPALNWVEQVNLPRLSKTASNYWYDPAKTYYQIYTSGKGIYKITYQQLANAGVQFSNTPVSKLELYNNGAEVPIYIADVNGDSVFNAGDYFEFVAYQPTPTPYASSNIYNADNVYFFSVQADSSGLRYKIKDGYPNKWDVTYQTNYTKLHFERDSLFENLGYAGDDKRDFWLWDRVIGNYGTPVHTFEGRFDGLKDMDPDSNHVIIRVQLQGLSTSAGCQYDHNALISLTDQPIGNIMWDAQQTATFEKTIYVSNDSIKIYPQGNILQVKATGDACQITNSDVFDVNWFDVEYWRDNRADTNHFEFTSSPNQTGIVRYWTWKWERDSIMVFIPQKGYLIKNAYIPHDEYSSALFVDTVTSSTDYFCAGYDYYLSPDSIIKTVPSDLRNTANGADYIIITHPDFKSVAERLAAFRQANFPDTSIANPRIKIVYVNQIYNEFSNGLLDPNALKEFVQYAFNNWQKPAPAYVVLLGDMSHDYRHVLTTSRPSFVPSVPFFTYDYGEGVSDNMIVAVSGDDIHPDLAIGRLSCETVDEGNVLVDKLMNYPADNSKQWKQNVLLVSAGLSADDENTLNLNDASMELANDYVEPNGIKTTKIMRYPSRPEYIQYQGEGPAIRSQIDNGAVLVNYYGHGGGYQWDLVFLNDDIYLLNNGGRLPLILSVTCYTAHFDDQDVFGEQFNKVQGKGSIGFFGNVGLTYWVVGKYFDDLVFDQIFNKKNYITGKVFQNVKNMLPAAGNNTSQIALLTYLGDPVLKLALPDKPDFSVNPGDITIASQNAVVNDTVQVQVKVQNLGVIFPGDSVAVQLIAESQDTSYQVGIKSLGNFAFEDSLFFRWIPAKTGLFNLTAKVNEINTIAEMDHSDNIASTGIPVYNLTEPSVIAPVDGFTTDSSNVEFKIADIGAYLSHPLTYYIQIDTSISFASPISSPPLSQSDGLIKWNSPALKAGIYFWRTRIYDGTDSSKWSQVRTFQTLTIKQPGYFVSGKQLELFDTDNLNSTDSGLVLNTNYHSPRPSSKTFLEDWKINTTVFDTVGITALTSDGTYLYFGNIYYYALRNNVDGNTKIYKIGTGNNGTIKGSYYGALPKFFAPIKNSMFYYSDGYIYVATGEANRLLRVNRTTGDTSSVIINAGFIRWDDARVGDGSFYITADSQYVYNLAVKDSLGENKYTLRILDPARSWTLVKPDLQLTGTSYNGFTGFFAADGYVYPYEYYSSGFMRRIRTSDGVFEEEWLTNIPFQSYYAWAYDWSHNRVYASVFRDDNKNWPPKISVFTGKYLDANGTATSVVIGPAASWTKINYYVQTSEQLSNYRAYLFGQNTITKNWDTLSANVFSRYDINNINPETYNYLKLEFHLSDSTFNIINPMKLQSLAVYYSPLPEIALDNTQFVINPDTVIKTIPVGISLRVRNLGDVPADSIKLKLYLNDASSEFYNQNISLSPDSSTEINTTLSTSDIFKLNKIKAVVTLNAPELFTFNDILQKNFYVIRDTAIPNVAITFDGKQILSGDIVSSRPKINISMMVNSPLPIDTAGFILLLDNQPVNLQDPNVNFSIVTSPKNGVEINLNPLLKDGSHSIDVLMKNQFGDYVDSLSTHVSFLTYNDYGLRNVYNYPNPFKSDTYITFEMTGQSIPEEMYIKIYTVAGRLIKDIQVPVSNLSMGFNKILWDGRDEDGDLVANGIYFYKIVYKNGEIVRSYTQKLAVIR